VWRRSKTTSATSATAAPSYSHLDAHPDPRGLTLPVTGDQNDPDVRAPPSPCPMGSEASRAGSSGESAAVNLARGSAVDSGPVSDRKPRPEERLTERLFSRAFPLKGERREGGRHCRCALEADGRRGGADLKCNPEPPVSGNLGNSWRVQLVRAGLLACPTDGRAISFDPRRPAVAVIGRGAERGAGSEG
jgi:hypothetical protein